MVEISESEYLDLQKSKNNEDKNKLYHKEYFQNTIKNKFINCPCCKIDIKYNSYKNHLVSRKHIKNSC